MRPLLSEVAEERPLLCVVDDAQWLISSRLQLQRALPDGASTGQMA